MFAAKMIELDEKLRHLHERIDDGEHEDITALMGELNALTEEYNLEQDAIRYRLNFGYFTFLQTIAYCILLQIKHITYGLHGFFIKQTECKSGERTQFQIGNYRLFKSFGRQPKCKHKLFEHILCHWVFHCFF